MAERVLSDQDIDRLGLNRPEHGSRVVQREEAGQPAPAGEPGVPGTSPYVTPPMNAGGANLGPLQPEGSAWDAVKSAANSAALHAGPQIAGGIGALANAATDPMGVNGSDLDAYRFVRDQTKKDLDASGKTRLGDVGDTAGAMLTPAPRGPAGVVRGGLTAAGMGAIDAAARSPADLTDPTWDKAKQVGLDALFGGLRSAPGGMAMGGVMGLAEKPLRQGARSMALDTVGVKPTAKAQMAKRGISDAAGDDVLSLMKPLGGAGAAATGDLSKLGDNLDAMSIPTGMRRGSLTDAVKEELARRGKAEGDVIDAIDKRAGGKVALPDVMHDAMTDRAVEMSRRSNVDTNKAAKIIGTEAEHFMSSHGDKPISLRQAEDYKRLFGAAAAAKNKASGQKIPRGKPEAHAAIYDVIRKANEDAAEAVAGSLAPNLKGKFVPAKDAYGRMASVAEGAGVGPPGMRESDFEWGDALTAPQPPGVLKETLGALSPIVSVPLNVAGRAYGRGLAAKGLEAGANAAARNSGGVVGGALARDAEEEIADEAKVDPLSKWSRFLRGPK